jgi:hypothetical protein
LNSAGANVKCHDAITETCECRGNRQPDIAESYATAVSSRVGVMHETGEAVCGPPERHDVLDPAAGIHGIIRPRQTTFRSSGSRVGVWLCQSSGPRARSVAPQSTKRDTLLIKVSVEASLGWTCSVPPTLHRTLCAPPS